MSHTRMFGALGVVLSLTALTGCSVEDSPAPVINRETAWVADYPALGEPVSAAAAVRVQGDSRIPAPDDLYDTVLEISPEAMDALVAEHADLAPAQLNSFTPAWVIDEVPAEASWQRSASLDAQLEDEDGRGLIVDCFLDVEHDRVVLVLMEM